MVSPISSNPAGAAAAKESGPIPATGSVTSQSRPAANAVAEDTVTISTAAQSVSAQSAAAAQAQITPKVPTPAEVRLLNRQGQTPSQIALKLDLSVQTVNSYLGTVEQTAAASTSK